MYTGNLAASAATAGYVVLAEGGIELAKSLMTMTRLLAAILPLLALLIANVHATLKPTSDTKAVCDALRARYPDKLVWDPLGPYGITTLGRSSAYNSANLDYWNAASSLNRAACAFFPATTDEVAFAVQTLNRYESVRFALKAGGHNPNLGWSSVSGGVLVAFRPNFQTAQPAADGKTVVIGAGCKWEDVYGVLQPLGKTVTGGRLGDVGTTGLLLGGGLSYLSAQHGFACDNVLNFETVLANGTVAHANATSNPDLFFALCGGGNRYAVVTKITMEVFESGVGGQVWGGVRIYTEDKRAAIIAAVARFTSENTDPKAAIIPTFDFAGVLALSVPVVIVAFFYDGVVVPAGIFDAFDAVRPLSDSTKVRTFVTMAEELLAGDMKGLRFRIGVNSFPAMPGANMTAFLNDHYDLVKRRSVEAALKEPLDFKIVSFAVQPMPRGIAQASRDRNGGNALGINPDHGDRVWIEYDIAWANPLCDVLCTQWLKSMVQEAHDLHVEKYSGIYPTNYQSGDLETLSYNPIFMNDALSSQPVLQSYGEQNRARLMAIQSAYDPHGFLMNRQDGPAF
ncbi:FAD-binding, type 2 [Cordyceps militaris CM01]|uniref:FAD-binding, type 2 n=1 Tax=Cordyceps militaris (strain CM01) TaxID=983644 RepID=G3JIV0_CORMM|nr:FAD-binding, type 2 [Cordyceps militaris CM01]EGX91944.1 FAD-binding, type 2 [Cordyceps militaris CM01]